MRTRTLFWICVVIALTIESAYSCEATEEKLLRYISQVVDTEGIQFLKEHIVVIAGESSDSAEGFYLSILRSIDTEAGYDFVKLGALENDYTPKYSMDPKPTHQAIIGFQSSEPLINDIVLGIPVGFYNCEYILSK